MSIEKLIAENTAALIANTAATEAQTALLEGGIAKKSTTTGKAASKAAPKKAAPKKAAPKKMTAQDFIGHFAPYLKVKDKDELNERKAQCLAIADYFGKTKVSEIEAADYAEALGYLETYKAGDEPDFAGGSEEESEEEEDVI